MQKQKSDARFMALALSLGRRGMGRVWPNPAVGCVIVRDGVIVGRGRTADGGRPHAETEALCQAGDKARGATAYVSLEPCSHHGKTPPCANALIDAGIAEVVVATGDPNPQVSGAGIAMLEAAGIAVRMGILKEQADADHAGFFLTQTRGRPYITLKLATTLDGHIATTTGDSQWITGPQARRLVHAMRARHDAVMVGAGTVRADDPELTCRLPGLRDRSPQPFVMSRHGNLPPTSHLAWRELPRINLSGCTIVQQQMRGTGKRWAHTPFWPKPKVATLIYPTRWANSQARASRGFSAKAAGNWLRH